MLAAEKSEMILYNYLFFKFIIVESMFISRPCFWGQRENKAQEVIRPNIPVCPVLRKARREEEEEKEEEEEEEEEEVFQQL